MQKNDRFGKEWSSGSNIQEFPSDSQAQQGLSFLGSTPPSFNLHDAMFMANDWKDNWLFDQIKNVTDAYGQQLDLSIEGDRMQLAAAMASMISGAAASQEMVDLGDNAEKFVTSKTLSGKIASASDAQNFSKKRLIDGEALKLSFQGPNQLKSNNGFQKLPGGMILQWMGPQVRSSGDQIKWPISFPSSIVFGSAVHLSGGATGAQYYSIKYTGLAGGEVLLPPGANAITTAVFLLGW